MGELIGGTECNGRPAFQPDEDGTCHVSAHAAGNDQNKFGTYTLSVSEADTM